MKPFHPIIAALFCFALSVPAHAADCALSAAELGQTPTALLAAKMAETPAECRYPAYMRAGVQFHDLKQFDPALTLFEGALKAAPCEGEAYLWVGGIYEWRGQFELAACHFQKGLALAQNDEKQHDEKLKKDFQAAYAEVSARLPAMPTRQLACSVELGRLIGAARCTGKLFRAFGDALGRGFILTAESGTADMRIHFDFDKAEISAQGADALNQLVAALKKDMGAVSRDLVAERDTPNRKKITVTLIGHTDERGQEAYNRALSRRRAEAVKTLLARDFPRADFQVEGKGKSEPVMKNAATEDQHALNRRVEIRVH